MSLQQQHFICQTISFSILQMCAITILFNKIILHDLSFYTCMYLGLNRYRHKILVSESAFSVNGLGTFRLLGLVTAFTDNHHFSGGYHFLPQLNKGTRIAESVVMFVSRLATYRCRVGSSHYGDINKSVWHVSVVHWLFPAGQGGSEGYYSAYGWELTWLSSILKQSLR